MAELLLLLLLWGKLVLAILIFKKKKIINKILIYLKVSITVAPGVTVVSTFYRLSEITVILGSKFLFLTADKAEGKNAFYYFIKHQKF